MENNKQVWCLIYVDDKLLPSPSKDDITECIELLKKEYTLTLVPEITQYLGMNIKHNVETKEVYISCCKYFDKISKKYNVAKSKRVIKTPLCAQTLTSQGESNYISQEAYQNQVSSLLYVATCCRPDIQFA